MQLTPLDVMALIAIFSLLVGLLIVALAYLAHERHKTGQNRTNSESTNDDYQS